jgi:hypothetical protein
MLPAIYFVPIASDHAIEPATVNLGRSHPRRFAELEKEEERRRGGAGG